MWCKTGATHSQPKEPDEIGQEGQALQEGCENNEVNNISVARGEREDTHNLNTGRYLTEV